MAREISVSQTSCVILSAANIRKLPDLLCWASEEQNGGIKELFIEEATAEIVGWDEGLNQAKARLLAESIWDFEEFIERTTNV